MTYSEFENLLLLADRMIASNNLRTAEYGKGYQSGIKFHIDYGLSELLPDHHYIAEIARRNGSRDVPAYVRGYGDGYKGLKPEVIG